MGDRPFSSRRIDTRRDGDLQIVEYRLEDDPPDLLALAHRQPERYPFLLESSAGAAAQSRYDLLLGFPQDSLSTVDVPASVFFDRLDTLQREQARAPVAGLPFVGGWFVYFGYEMAAGVEARLSLDRALDDYWPDAFAVRCDAAVIHDRVARRLFMVAREPATEHIATMAADLAKAETPSAAPLAATWREAPAERYADAVARARDYIQAGDVFQVNLSRPWQGRLAESAPPARTYAALRAANPAPFSALVQWQDAALVCSSPERLLGVIDGRAETRPIAGTRARSQGTDAVMTAELLAHPKERAEHIMLIDLERNDLGRCCVPGSIRVDELMVLESYAHVHHIVSNVSGRLHANTGAGAAIRAVFPGGTITGCPKVRCMEIIAELEEAGRGAYTGSVGYLSRCGRLDTNIVIRSLTQRDRDLTLRTGAGIVADSIAEAELAETRSKARGVLRAFVDAQGRRHG